MKKNKEKKLTKKEQNLIKDTVNDHLKSILEDIGLQNNEEALLYARDIFYRG